jgi:hypothetical protein
MPLTLVAASCAQGPYPTVIETHTSPDGSFCQTVQLDIFMSRQECVPRSYVEHPTPAERYVPDQPNASGSLIGARMQGDSLPSEPRLPTGEENLRPPTDEDFDSGVTMDDATRERLDQLKKRLESTERVPLQEEQEPTSQPRRRQQRTPQARRQADNPAPTAPTPNPQPPTVAVPVPVPQPSPPVKPAPSAATGPDTRSPNARGGPVY